MKKWLLIVWLCCFAVGQAQEKMDYKDAQSLTFFGVDYSFVRLYGAGEEPYQYKMLFREMNTMLRAEPDKYNLKKFFGKSEVVLSFDNTLEVNNAIDPNGLKIFNKEYNVSEGQVKEYIASFYTGDATGYGAVLICTLLDRSKSRGQYYIVVFDIDSKEIIRIKQVETKASGNTFQNYWAATILNALKLANK